MLQVLSTRVLTYLLSYFTSFTRLFTLLTTTDTVLQMLRREGWREGGCVSERERWRQSVCVFVCEGDRHALTGAHRPDDNEGGCITVY